MGKVCYLKNKSLKIDNFHTWFFMDDWDTPLATWQLKLKKQFIFCFNNVSICVCRLQQIAPRELKRNYARIITKSGTNTRVEKRLGKVYIYIRRVYNYMHVFIIIKIEKKLVHIEKKPQRKD